MTERGRLRTCFHQLKLVVANKMQIVWWRDHQDSSRSWATSFLHPRRARRQSAIPQTTSERQQCCYRIGLYRCHRLSSHYQLVVQRQSTNLSLWRWLVRRGRLWYNIQSRRFLNDRRIEEHLTCLCLSIVQESQELCRSAGLAVMREFE